MDEGNQNQFNVSSLDNMSTEQDNYDQVWNVDFFNDSYFSNAIDLNLIDVGMLLPDVENRPSTSGTQLINCEIKPEHLDSCQLNNANQQEQNAQQQNLHQVLQQSVITVSTSAQIPQQMPSSSIPPAASSLPASQTWPGEYEFSISFGSQEKNTKGVAWTYSSLKDKLYVRKDVPCPINFSANSCVPDDVFIRVTALYTAPDQVSEIVKRCVNHSMEEIRNDVFEAEHLVRCESPNAIYNRDVSTKRHSVIIPFENPPVGQQFSTYIFKFTCFGSCAGGPNRRPIMLIFTLERRCGIVIGRRKLDIKICACPGRDRKSEESQVMKVEESDEIVSYRTNETSNILGKQIDSYNFTRNNINTLTMKKKIVRTNDGPYILKVDDIDCFEYLKQMEKYYKLYKWMQQLAPDITQALLNHQKRKRSDETE